MSKAIDSLYGKCTVNAKRVDTDKLFIDERSENSFEGFIDKTARYIEDFQLLSAEDWARFVEQFKVHSDSDDNGWRGEYWGKMMRGASFTYSYTKNKKLYDTLTATVEDMLSAEEASGRISTYSTETEFNGWDMWSRKYVLLGMQYFSEICTDENLNKRMIASMMRQVDYIIAHIGDGKLNINDTSACWRGLPSSSILEPVVRLYDITGEKRFLDFAEYIVNMGGTNIVNIFELAYEDKTDPYQYPITKAYETISCFEGLLEYYRATGIEKYKQAVVNFGRRLAKTDITIIGSAGCTHEYFDHAAVRQTDPALTRIMQETCVTVTWMKFCMQLLLITGEAEFADQFERSLYNAYLGSVNTEKIVDELVLKQYPDAILVPLPFDSYSSLLPNTRGRGIGGLKLMPDNHYYGCCACIGSAGIGMVHKLSTMIDEKGVTLNLYIPGKTVTVTPENNKLELDFSTDYPRDGKIGIAVSPEQEETFTVSLRIPAWSRKTFVTVNGEKTELETIANAYYYGITRKWAKGDKIILELDMRARVIHPVPNPVDIIFTAIQWQYQYTVPRIVHESPEAKYHIAIERGPIVLARDARLDGTVDEAVDIAYDADGFVELAPSNKAKFDTVVEYAVPQNNGKTFTVIDYSSAGKTWREDSKYACWLPTKEYWR